MTRSKIAWTDRTWNPVSGCSPVSAGCANCYAARYAARKLPKGGFADREFSAVRCHPERLGAPLRWRKPSRVFVDSMSDLFHESVPFEFIAAVFGVMAHCPQHTFQVLTKRPARMREFFAELWRRAERSASVFPFDSQEWRAIHVCRAAAIRETTGFQHDARQRDEWPLPNVWLGVSVENQGSAERRIPILLDTPASVRFASAEPLIGPVVFGSWIVRTRTMHMCLDVAGDLRNRAFDGFADAGRPLSRDEAEAELQAMLARGERLLPLSECDDFDPATGCRGHRQPSLDWVIVGGESGPGARPCRVEWIRGVARQCKAAGVPVFVKQLGAYVLDRNDAGFSGGDGDAWNVDDARVIDEDHERHQGASVRVRLRDPKGGDMAEWPEDLRVRQVPEAAR